MKDIKDILLKSQKNELTVEQTFNEIFNLIKENGYYTGDDIKTAFELGQLDKENNIQSKDELLQIFNNDIDELVNFISTNGFFSKSDIDSWYKIGSINKVSDRTPDEIKEICLKAFNMYLLLNWD